MTLLSSLHLEFSAFLARAIALGLVFTVAAPAPAAQAPRWGESLAVAPRRRAGMAYDATRARTVMLGGITTRGLDYTGSVLRETWESSGADWTRRTDLPFQPGGLDPKIVFDPTQRRSLAVSANNETLELHAWEGRTWSLIRAALVPSYRLHFAAAFDETRRRLVVWGGSSSTGAQLDVLEYDGTNWTTIPASGPAGRNEPAMAYDGGRIVMFGGRATSNNQVLNDTWEWDGTTWTQRNPTNVPTARNGHSLTWNSIRRRVVLFGGGTESPGPVFNDTWEWDGTNWNSLVTTTPPPARSGHSAAYDSDRGRLLIAFGETEQNLLADTWELVGGRWREVIPAEAPAERSDHAACFDAARNQVVLFGGRNATTLAFADTWVRQLTEWQRADPTTTPRARFDHAMAFDSVRNQVVLFGGSGAGVVLNDTWLWNGSAWTMANPTTAPPARAGHAMAFDSARNRLVLYGGAQQDGTLLADTWEWDGSTWTAGPTGPLARVDHGMAFDAARAQIVMFGGRINPTTRRQDTWTYDGIGWTDRNTTNVSARSDVGMAYDPIRARVVLFGGQSSATTYTQSAFEWDGMAWSLPFLIFTPAARGGHSLTWDGRGRHSIAFGGINTVGRLGDTWIYGANAAARVDRLAPRSGCSGASGNSVLTPYGVPSIGNGSFALDLTTVRAQPGLPVVFFLSLNEGTASLGTCQLHVDPQTLFAVAYGVHDERLTSLPIPIPPMLSLLGASFVAQAAYVDPPSSLGGIAFSIGARVTIGDN